MRKCQVRELGRIAYGPALGLQQQLIAARKAGTAPDHLLLLEHPHVITLGRNGRQENLLASEEIMERAGISFFPTDRGGDVTYHGPGQLVAYPIMDLREWKRDVGAFVRAVEQTIIDTLADYGIEAGRIPKLTGVWAVSYTHLDVYKRQAEVCANPGLAASIRSGNSHFISLW